MDAPNKIYVEVCEDGIFAFPEPPFKESVEYIRADLVGQSLQQEQLEVDLEKTAEFECIGKKVKMTVKELIDYYINTECCEVAEECGF